VRQKAESCTLAALLGADGSPGAADPLGQLAFVIRWERGEIGGSSRTAILMSRFERSINPVRASRHFGCFVFRRDLARRIITHHASAPKIICENIDEKRSV
jgi:hypothetical protein